MSYASKAGRARTSSTSPEAHAICDRCGCRYNLIDLSFQFDWRGASLQNLRVLVCPPCLDTPQQQLRAIVVPADPVPKVNARVQDFAAAETDYMALTPATTDPTTGIPVPSVVTMTTVDGTSMTETPLGAPVGLEQGAVMPLSGRVAYGVVIDALSVSSTGTPIVTVTCRSPHGLVTNGQVSIEGLSAAHANGFFSVTVISAMAFTYQTGPSIPAGSLLTPTTRIITAIVGLPLNYAQIPQTGA